MKVARSISFKWSCEFPESFFSTLLLNLTSRSSFQQDKDDVGSVVLCFFWLGGQSATFFISDN
jgi:hypothetical protein